VRPIHVAALHGNLDIIKYLVMNGAKITVKSKEYPSGSPIFSALIYNHQEIIKYLIDQGCDINSRDKSTNQSYMIVLLFIMLRFMDTPK